MVLALTDQGADVTVLSMTAAYLADKQDRSDVWKRLKPCTIPIGPGPKRQPVRAALCCLRYGISIWPRWIDQVLRTAAQLHDAHPFDFVYSRSLPMFAHVAGYWTAKQLRRPWIANINDPWDEHLFPGKGAVHVSRLYRQISGYWLRKTLACADVVTYPSARLAGFTAGLAKADRCGAVVPHVGWSSTGSGAEGQGFRLVHAGKLGSNEITGRSTRALLAALRRFLDREPGAADGTRLILVGPEDANGRALIEQLGLGSNVTHVGQVSYQESLRHIASASACILVEAEMPEGVYLPSKLADYLVARKPVLALSPRVGTIADLAAQGLTRVDAGDEEGIERAIHSLYRSYRDTCLVDMTPSESLIAQFSGDQIARRFLALGSDARSTARHSSPAVAPEGGARALIRGGGSAREAYE